MSRERCGIRSLFALASAIGLFALTDRAAAQPKLAVATGYWNAGYHPRQSFVPFEFPLRNAGTEPLKLQVEGTCDCVFVDQGEVELAPGQAFALSGHIETLDQQGERQAGVRIQSNDPDRKVLDLRIDYWVNVHVATDVPLVWLGAVKPGQRVEREVLLKSMLGLKGKIEKAVAEVDHVKAEIKEATLKPDEPGRILIRYEAPKTIGLDSSVLFVYSDLGREKAIPLPIEAMVSNHLVGEFSILDFGDVAVGQTTKKAISFAWLGEATMKVENVYASSLSGNLVQSAKEGRWTLKMEWTGKEPFGPTTTGIKLRFNEDGEKQFAIPARAQILP